MRLELSLFLSFQEIIWEGMELHTWLPASPSARGLLSSELRGKIKMPDWD